jgi:predicted SnoaL-like aldol condensation-catalyzing enzyme
VAESRNLNIILSLKDQASSQLKGFQGKMQSLEPTFKKMAVAGTAAFTAVTVAVGKTVKDAAMAEGAYNKFNTVFGDGADDMLAFVDDLRKEMPTATHEIVRLAADMQDLLVPMGLARGQAQEMSQGFLDVANKIAAFNDVNPSEVLEAIKSGLAGSSEPLKRFGVNALETSLEARALKDGLLEAGQSFKDLEPDVRAQVRAQALLAQVVDNSSNAINGFAENNDSLIRRQQDLRANMQELSVTLGTIFIPIVDSIVKKILPIVHGIQQWIQENPKLAKVIIMVVMALTALVAILGTLGLVITAVSIAFAPLTLTILLITALIIGLGLAVYAVIKHWEQIKEFFVNIFNFLKQVFITYITNQLNMIKFFLEAIKNTWETIWGGIRDFFIDVWDTIIDVVKEKVEAMKDFLAPVVDMIKQVVDGLKEIGAKVGGKIKGLFGGNKNGGAINDGIVQNGKIITTHPEDTIMAMKNPAKVLGGAGGGGLNITITGNTFMSQEDFAEKVGKDLMKVLKQNVKLT